MGCPFRDIVGDPQGRIPRWWVGRTDEGYRAGCQPTGYARMPQGCEQTARLHCVGQIPLQTARGFPFEEVEPEMGLETVPGTQREVSIPAPDELKPVEIPKEAPVEAPELVPR